MTASIEIFSLNVTQAWGDVASFRCGKRWTFVIAQKVMWNNELLMEFLSQVKRVFAIQFLLCGDRASCFFLVRLMRLKMFSFTHDMAQVSPSPSNLKSKSNQTFQIFMHECFDIFFISFWVLSSFLRCFAWRFEDPLRKLHESSEDESSWRYHATLLSAPVKVHSSGRAIWSKR